MTERNTLHIVDSNWVSRAHLARLAENAGLHAETYSSAEELVAYAPSDGLVISHDNPPATAVTSLIEAISKAGRWLPVIAVSDQLESGAIVKAMRAGALDYLPIPRQVAPLSAAIARSAAEVDMRRARQSRAAAAQQRISQLTERERQILDLVATGATNKVMARELGISPRTVEVHRLNMMNKLGCVNSVDAARVNFEATELWATI